MVPAFRQLSKFIGRFTGRRPLDSGVDADSAVDESAPATQGAPPEPALVIPGHELLRVIGQGAYGEVWLARDEIGAYHAVKVIHKRTFADRNPFEREYRGILQYTPISRTHHGLVPILHVGRENEAGFFYYVMEVADCVYSGRAIDPATYCPRTLAHELDTRGRLPARECLQLGLELGEALRYLHSRQLIHRDIKPANIIFVNGMAKLADVGLITHVAEARRDPKHLGTEGFTPPEGPGTLWADVYSLGKVLCETSMGHASVQDTLPPFSEKEVDELLPLNEIFLKACHDDLACRYQSVEEVQHDLMRLYDQLYGGVQDARS
jgi:serine/threonine protein kinase